MKIEVKGVYELDLIKGTNVPTLTEKNSQFIEAILKLDSNYKKENGIVPDKHFSLNLVNKNKKKTYFAGSSGFWFNEMKNKQSIYTYKQCVLGTVISIDRTNSTHLEIAKNGRKMLVKRIISRYPNVNKLMKALKEDFKASNKHHLISVLTEGGLPLIKKTCCNLFPISFVSKFCSCASIALLGEDLYSKYDKVVSNVLPRYIYHYFSRSEQQTKYKIKSYKEYNKKKEEGLIVYQLYNEVIGDFVRDKHLTRSQIDHILWYCSKG